MRGRKRVSHDMSSHAWDCDHPCRIKSTGRDVFRIKGGEVGPRANLVTIGKEDSLHTMLAVPEVEGCFRHLTDEIV